MFNNPTTIQNTCQLYNTPHFGIYHPLNQTAHMHDVHSGYGWPHFNYPSYNTMGNNDPSVITKTKRQEATQDIESFIEENMHSDDAKKQDTRPQTSNIAIARNALISVCKLKEKIESVCTELKGNANLSELQWQEKIDICHKAECQIRETLQFIKSESFLNNLKQTLAKRKKKRLREKVKLQKWKSEKLYRAEKRARLHAEADSWIRSKQNIIDREKQEENLRKDADMILSDVRGKRSDARKYLGLLQELQNLRNIKINIARARGEHLSSVADETFNSIIGKLMEQWSTLDREYSLEEQGLKLMLKTDNEKRIEKQKKNIFDEWESALFGNKLSILDQYHRNFHGFIMIRTAWDKFISYHNTNATAIPIGWIVPDKPSSAAWQKCLKKEVP